MMASTGKRWVERCGFSRRTKLIQGSSRVMHIESFGSSEVVKFDILVALAVSCFYKVALPVLH
jgi:hypothetical protein